ncbi:hypothetical protein [Enterococcus sp. AZ102]|uniref:hypothetical protein n=1 Tax=Enterococcus sp. AZ102 TaxID=2774865 RepID=UPI003F210F22
MAKTKIATAEKRKSRASKRAKRLLALHLGDLTGDYSFYESEIRTIPPGAAYVGKTLIVADEDYLNSHLIHDSDSYIRFNYRRKKISDIAKDLNMTSKEVVTRIRQLKVHLNRFYYCKLDNQEIIGSIYQLSKLLYVDPKQMPLKIRDKENFIFIETPFELISKYKKSRAFNELKKKHKKP